MKKLLPLLLTIFIFSGCAAGSEADSAACTITDDLGRSVSIDNPQRVASLLGSFSDVWVLAGGELVASVDDAWDDFDLDLGAAVNLGKTKEPSLEKLFESDPDFVIASANTQADLDMMDTLDAAGIPTAYFDVSDFEDYLRLLKICTGITGRSDLYEQNGLAIQSRIEESIARTKAHFGDTPPKVLYLRASAASIRAKNSHGNVLGEMLSDLGCVNIADSDDSLLENLSTEHILAQDPDFIFFVQLGDDTEGTQANIEAFFSEHPAWQELTAVKGGNVYSLDKRLYNLKPNALWADAYEQLEEIICENTP